jgi:hypothetical protein
LHRLPRVAAGRRPHWTQATDIHASPDSKDRLTDAARHRSCCCIQIESGRKCGWLQVADTGLRALPVVKHFDVLADGESGLLLRGQSLLIDHFALQRTPKQDSIGALS